MTHYYTSSTDGNNAYDGLAPLWTGVHGPKLTITAGEALLAAGDWHHVRPGVYREIVTWGVSGGSTYQVGAVNVTNGSAVVVGVGTLWLANVAADYMFNVIMFASGADGVTNGTATFTSAAGNFQAAMIGQIIQINARGAYKIANVAAANSITLSDPNGLGWPGAGVGLTYSVMSGMGPFDVLSVDGNTQLTLTAPWYGPTLTGLAYITYNPIRTIGDVAGQIWGVGGTVRITGSDNDQTAVRANCITSTLKSYRVLRGFSFDTTTSYPLSMVSATHITIEDCTIQTPGSIAVYIGGAGQLAVVFRRCRIEAKAGVSVHGINFFHTVTVDNTCHLISNCLIVYASGSGASAIASTRIGGISIRNCDIIGNTAGIKIITALTVGQTIVILNSVLQSDYTALVATAVGELTENYNTLSGNTTNYTNTAIGVNTLTYPPLFALPLLSAGQAGISGFRLPPPLLGELSQWSQIRALAGFGEALTDLFGLKRPATSAKNSWGAVQYQNQLRDTTTVRTGMSSLKLTDAGRQQIIIPVEAVNTTITVYVYREANYAGINPQMILKQAGQADITVTDAGGAAAWNALTHTWIPAVVPNYIAIELVSHNTALAGAYGIFFDDLTVTPLDTDTMEAWTADVQHINYAEELATASAAFSPVGGEIVGA